ncbi:MAG: hypothetical protein INQ03_22890 [Candidatus Heimdallarchaeota archaeon]|nr:hypothetical protein [Candidatus Heimdallarchaeota archaeon]
MSNFDIKKTSEIKPGMHIILDNMLYQVKSVNRTPGPGKHGHAKTIMILLDSNSKTKRYLKLTGKESFKVPVMETFIAQIINKDDRIIDLMDQSYVIFQLDIKDCSLEIGDYVEIRRIMNKVIITRKLEPPNRFVIIYHAC